MLPDAACRVCVQSLGTVADSGGEAMRLRQIWAWSILPGLTAMPSAWAATDMSCGQAMEHIHYHPGIEANSILAIVAGTWHGMDQQTTASGHAAIAGKMLASQQAMNGLVRQCRENPGQSIQASAAAIYLLARQELDGY
jgi:hypothetical protein